MASILTFYSYKGGVGRTMALANIAILLARKGLRVLVVDWDLEAPGLHRYFNSLKVKSAKLGLLDLLLASGKDLARSPDWQTYSSIVVVDDSTRLTMLTAGKFDEMYEGRVLAFDWSLFFKEQNGGLVLESLRRQRLKDFDVTLIDSRTGISDSGGVCTVQMPDVLVPVFAPNHQSLEGTRQVVVKAQQARQSLAYDRTRFLVFPIISKFDSRTEYRESQSWLHLFAEELKEFYSDWLPKDTNIVQILEQTKIPYIAFFSFGEKLPVLTEGATDPESLGFAYESAATLIANDFKGVDQFLLPASVGRGREDIPDRLVARLKTHRGFIIPRLENVQDYGFVGIYCSPSEFVSLNVDKLQLFLNINRMRFAEEIHYFEAFDVFQNGVSIGYFPRAIRSDIRSTYRVTLYTDGLAALDAQADALMNKDHKMHLGWLTYELQRHLQLTKALLQDSGASRIQVFIDFDHINEFALFFGGMGFLQTATYSGRHEPITRSASLGEIYDYDGPQRNIAMPIVEDIIAEVCRIFGLAKVPAGIWNQARELLYVKGLEGSR